MDIVRTKPEVNRLVGLAQQSSCKPFGTEDRKVIEVTIEQIAFSFDNTLASVAEKWPWIYLDHLRKTLQNTGEERPEFFLPRFMIIRSIAAFFALNTSDESIW